MSFFRIPYLISLTCLVAAAQQTSTFSGDLFTLNGKPSALYNVELNLLTSNLPQERTVSNSDGKFEFHNVRTANYTLFVKTDNGEIVGILAVSSAMANSPIHVQITEAQKSKPVTGTVSAVSLRHHPPKKAVQEMNASIKAANSGNKELAQEHLRAAIRIDPDFGEAHTNLGAEYTRANKLDLAYTEFAEALRIGPRGAMQYCNIAVVAAALNHREEAEDEVRKALLIDSRSPQSNFLLGRMLAPQPDRYDEAVKHLKLATEDIANANMILAQLYAQSGHKREAIAALQNYEQVNPAANREKVDKMILSLR